MLIQLSLSTQVSALTTLFVMRLCSDSELLQDVRSETARFAKVTPADQSFSIPSPPRLKIDASGLQRSCPLLKACGTETLRLDTFPVTISGARGNKVPNGKGSEDRSSDAEAATQSKTSSCFLITLPAISGPSSVQPQSPSSHGLDDADTLRVMPLRPWERSHSASLGSAFVAKMSLTYATGLLALWEFQFASRSTPILKGPLEFPSVIKVPSEVKAHVFRRKIK